VRAAPHPVGAPPIRGRFRAPEFPLWRKFHLPEPVSKASCLRGPIIVQETDISTSFEGLGLIPELLRAVAEQGYTTPTPIQAQAIPLVLSGRDLLGAAQTGTGKTAGFTLPLLQRLAPTATKSFSPALHPVRCLILTPTRELAIQVHDSVKTYGKHVPLRSFCVYGGININPQIEELKRGVEILVATPGRLLDLVGQKAVNLGKVQILVLDEADRMLDMGFIPDIKRIIALLPAMRQTLLFSATFSDEIRRLSAQFLKDPATVEVARRNTPVEAISQYVYFMDANRKRELLAHLVKKNDWDQVLVFCKTKHGANRLASQLQKDHINADAIHGNKSQNARIRALEDFKAGKVKVLVATDIAARGLDIEELPHVVNFDLPHVAEDYVHRIGRTGRAGATGQALSLVCAEDRPLLGAIERLINKKIEVRHVDGFEAGRPGKAEPGHAPARAPGAEREGKRGEPQSRRGGESKRGGDESRRGGGESRRGGEESRQRPGRSRDRQEERAPRYSPSAAPKTSGNSAGMDFNKPYEPSPSAASSASEEAAQSQKRRSTQPIPALFRKKAA
jgi:ATP-dependent RNA helicase RhlE